MVRSTLGVEGLPLPASERASELMDQGRASQGKPGQGRAGQGRAGPGTTSRNSWRHMHTCYNNSGLTHLALVKLGHSSDNNNDKAKLELCCGNWRAGGRCWLWALQ